MNSCEKKKCEYCVYAVVTIIYSLIITFAIPSLERELMRVIIGAATFCAGAAGAIVCFSFAYWQNKSHALLSIRLRDVYLATGILAIMTAIMGLGGAFSFSREAWDVAYNYRLLPLILEVVALMRLFYTMRHL